MFKLSGSTACNCSCFSLKVFRVFWVFWVFWVLALQRKRFQCDTIQLLLKGQLPCNQARKGQNKGEGRGVSLHLSILITCLAFGDWIVSCNLVFVIWKEINFTVLWIGCCCYWYVKLKTVTNIVQTFHMILDQFISC